MKQNRFLIIAWPADHEEDLAYYANQIQDFLNLAQVGGAIVIAPPMEATCSAIEQFEDHQLDRLNT